MLTVCDSVLGLTPGLQLGARHGRAVTGRGTATAVHCRRAPKAFLRFLFATFGHALYRLKNIYPKTSSHF